MAANNLAVINTYFKKNESRKINYTGGGLNSQVDYVICKRSQFKRMQDCRVLSSEAVAKQHKVVICTGTIRLERRRTTERTRKIRWWKLSDADHRDSFEGKAVAAINEQNDKSWEETSSAL